MGFAVIHIEKGTAGKAGGLGAHIERTKNVPNADSSKTHQNARIDLHTHPNDIRWTKEKHTESLQQRINNRIKNGYTGKTAIRKDAVTHLNIVMTGSHKEMADITKNKKLKDWANDNFRFAVQRYGRDNIVEFSIHLDERTPHIHCVVVPLTADGRLSAKEVMGNRTKMTDLQEQYGKAMQPYNLQRGIKGSTATHDSIQEYYARINQRLTPQPYTYVSINEPAPTIDKPPMFGDKEKWAEKQNKAILSGFRELEDKILRAVNEKGANELKTALTEKIKAEEERDRLRKENAQLRGTVKEQDKKLNPERYENRQEQERKTRLRR